MPTQTALPTRTPPASSTPPASPTSVRCDPYTADYCISEGHFILQRPIRPPANDAIDPTYRFGITANGTRDPHHGVEFVNEDGTPVHAGADGEVVFAGPDEEAIYSPWNSYYGNLIVLEHAGGLHTLYAHLSDVAVAPGMKVLAGQEIGSVGSTGTAFGSHLHFEVRVGDPTDYFSARNPELWIPPRPGSGAIQISLLGPDSSFISTEFTIQFHSAPNQPAGATYYLSTYVRALTTGDENAAISDLAPGQYRIAFVYNGRLHERWVEVESGKLTQVVLKATGTSKAHVAFS